MIPTGVPIEYAGLITFENTHSKQNTQRIPSPKQESFKRSSFVNQTSTRGGSSDIQGIKSVETKNTQLSFSSHDNEVNLRT